MKNKELIAKLQKLPPNTFILVSDGKGIYDLTDAYLENVEDGKQIIYFDVMEQG
jgi:hypothetical protein